MFFGVLHCSLHIGSGRYPQYLLNYLGREMPSISSARDSGAFTDLVWLCQLHASCSLLGQYSEVCVLSLNPVMHQAMC